MPANLIIFEGGEGAGKTTLVRALYDHYVGVGVDVVMTREPGGSPGAETIRTLLKHPDSTTQHVPEAHLLLHYAARMNHVQQTIVPALARGALVICDRFEVSSYAYQVHAMGVSPDLFTTLHRSICDQLRAQLTQGVYVHCDIDAAAGLQRARAQVGEASAERAGDDAYDSLPIEFHESLRAGMLAAKQHIDATLFTHVHIDASQPAPAVQAAAVAALAPFGW